MCHRPCQLHSSKLLEGLHQEGLHQTVNAVTDSVQRCGTAAPQMRFYFAYTDYAYYREKVISEELAGRYVHSM